VRRVAFDHAADAHDTILGVGIGAHCVQAELNVLNCVRELVRQQGLRAHLFVVAIDDRDRVIAAAIVRGDLVDPVLGLRFGNAVGRLRYESHQAKAACFRVLAREVFQVETAAHLVRVLFDRNRSNRRRVSPVRPKHRCHGVIDATLAIVASDVAIENVRQICTRRRVFPACRKSDDRQHPDRDRGARHRPRPHKKKFMPINMRGKSAMANF